MSASIASAMGKNKAVKAENGMIRSA